MSRTPAKTAAQFLAERRNDPACAQRQRKHNDHVARARGAYADAGAGLFAELAAAGDPEGGVRWSAVEALEGVVDDRQLADVVRIATDPSGGDDRTMAVVALGRMRKSRDVVVPVLHDLLQQPATTGCAMEALGNLKDPSQAAAIEPLLDDVDPWIRERAQGVVQTPPRHRLAGDALKLTGRRPRGIHQVGRRISG